MVQTLIPMTEKELSRADVLNNLINEELNGTEAAKQLNLSIRQTKRLKAAVLEKGTEALAHGNRGKPSNRQVGKKNIDKIIKLIKTKYSDFGPTFACEKLYEDHDVKIGREKIRQLMIAEKLWKPKHRKQSKNKHIWRARKDNYGEMQQFDGSYHYWLEDRNEELCLLLSVDDATGKITYAKFDYNESTVAVFKFWQEYLEKNGLPIAIYLDKFSTYKVNHKNATDNAELITQFQRAMNQLGVNPITAHSPEAKGRVERMFGTLQDRLVKELRLAGISTIEDANKFLEEFIPKFNAKFSVIPSRKTNLHKKISKTLKAKLPQILSIQKQRKVHNDYTIMFETKYFQLDIKQPTTVYKKDTVTIETHLDGEIKINLKGYYLKYQVLPERPQKQINVKLPALTVNKQTNWIPPKGHPWRKQFLFGQKLNGKQKATSN